MLAKHNPDGESNIIVRRHAERGQHRPEQFTGLVVRDILLDGDDTEFPRLSRAVFPPEGRSFWHCHSGYQLLYFTGGAGLVATPQEVVLADEGDVVYVAPLERHWHGATANSYAVHLAVTVGTTDWDRPVTDAEFRGSTESD